MADWLWFIFMVPVALLGGLLVAFVAAVVFGACALFLASFLQGFAKGRPADWNVDWSLFPKAPAPSQDKGGANDPAPPTGGPSERRSPNAMHH